MKDKETKLTHEFTLFEDGMVNEEANSSFDYVKKKFQQIFYGLFKRPVLKTEEEKTNYIACNINIIHDNYNQHRINLGLDEIDFEYLIGRRLEQENYEKPYYIQ